MFYILFFVYGVIIGSFLNVCICRIPKGESLTYPPSHCTDCGVKIKSYNLIPIISYVLLRGRCNSCKSKISIQYPIIEALNGIIYMGLYYKFGLGIEVILFAYISSILIVISGIDLFTNYVYKNTIIAGLIGFVIFFIYKLMSHDPVISNIIGGAVGFGIIALIILLSKGGMGWGDSEIALICGLFLGLKLTILTLFLAFLIGGIAGIILILTKKKNRKDFIPFGPYIVCAFFITLMVGQKLISLYMQIFNY